MTLNHAKRRKGCPVNRCITHPIVREYHGKCYFPLDFLHKDVVFCCLLTNGTKFGRLSNGAVDLTGFFFVIRFRPKDHHKVVSRGSLFCRNCRKKVLLMSMLA